MDENKKYEFKGVGLSKYEKTLGKEKFKKYCNHYHIEAYSDLQMLEELIYQELMQERLKEKATQLEEKNKNEKKEYTIPRTLVETMKVNFDQILIIKEKLGMFENKEGQDGFAYIQKLKDKFKKWNEENQGSRTCVCPHCSKIILLKIRTEAWEAQKHPFFQDKLLANKSLWKLYKEGKITKQEVGEILGCSDRYIDWLEKHIYQAPAED
jgi:DNA-directed RNA polymerase subunit RPC12/RpoP